MFTRKTKILSSSIVAAMSLALLADACASSTDKTPAKSPSAQKPAAELKRFYDQKLTFGSCKSYATTATEEKLYVAPFECGRLEVPLNYDNPQGETMQIGVLRLPARGEHGQRIGSLVINPGGPGGSGMTVAVLSALGLKDSPVLQRFDMVGFDPRGVGASTPAISCFTDEENDRGKNQTTLLGTSGEWTAANTRQLMEKCAEGSGGNGTKKSSKQGGIKATAFSAHRAVMT